MSARLAAGIEVSALCRRVAANGGNAAVIARGDPEAGAILIDLIERGRRHGLFERRLGDHARYVWQATGPQDVEDDQVVNAYIQRRRIVDADLWVVELDVAGVERFAAELTATG